MRFIDIITPIRRYLPYVKEPEKNLSINEKIVYTAWVLFVFLICS